MRTRPVVTVQAYWAGKDADGRDVTRAMIRLRGDWIEDVFAVGDKVRVTREERAGRLCLVIEAAERSPNWFRQHEPEIEAGDDSTGNIVAGGFHYADWRIERNERTDYGGERDGLYGSAAVTLAPQV